MRTSLAVLLAVPLAVAAAAAADAAPDKRLKTVADPTIPNGVAVYRRAGSSPTDYWCNAGDFAKRKLGAGNGMSLELVRPEGAAGGPADAQTIGFSLVQGGDGSVTVSVSKVGERHSISQTTAFCLSQRSERDR